MMNLFLTKQNEFQLMWLYIPAVLFHGWLAVKDPFIVDVYWDSVFYKDMAFGIVDWQQFQLKQHFPIPPFYSFLLSLGVIRHDYLLTETLQSWMNPALYFLTIIPVYALTRLSLSMPKAVSAAVVFALYPTSIYTQWTLSENAAFPLGLMCFYYAVKSLLHPRLSPRDLIPFTILIAANLLTRVQMLAFVLPLLGCCIAIRRWNRYPLTGFITAGVCGCSLWGWVLYGLGYFHQQGEWLIYSKTDEIMKRSIIEYSLVFLNRLYAHWTALWIEGGWVLPAIPLAACLAAGCGLISFSSETRKGLTCWLVTSICVVLSITLYRLTRLDQEYWSVSLRHLSYVNLTAIPLVFMVFAEAGKTHKTFILIFFFAIIHTVFAGSLFLPEVWEGLTRPKTYFSNAPTLDVMEQLKHSGPLAAGLLFITFGTLLSGLLLRQFFFGCVLWTGVLVYLYGCSIDYVLEDRHYAIGRMGYPDIHTFCSQLQAGRWKTYRIYCMEDERVQYLRPNLIYWLNQPCSILAHNAPKPEPPFLYLTFREEQYGELVFQSNQLKAYLYR